MVSTSQMPAPIVSTTAHRKCLIGVGIVFLVLMIFGVDRLIHLRKLMNETAAIKGIGAIYFGCDKAMVPIGPIDGRSVIEECKPDVDPKFKQAALQITVYPGGCTNKSVIAWSPELHYWAESWMLLAPIPKRAVLFDDGHSQCVTLDEFASFECP